ncbi:MAG: MFS transporter [Actinomycetia bacterium]|nr:MFS transporter [Actinomycetes bacterium]
MANIIRYQSLLSGVPQNRLGSALSVLFGLENLARSITVTSLPLAGLRLLGDEQVVSTYLFVAGALAIFFVLVSGALIRLFTRKYVFSLACVMLVVAAGSFIIQSEPFYIVGAMLRSASAGIILLCISLYILDFIPKDSVVHVESTRVSYASVAWLIGAPLGAWLFENVSVDLPFIIAAVVAMAELGLFWLMRIRETKNIVPPKDRNTRFLRMIVRYFSNRHLATAYVVAVSRSMYWAVLYTFVPLYVVAAELPSFLGGMVLSVGMTFLLFSPLIGRMATRIGILRSIRWAMGLAGVFAIIGGILCGMLGDSSIALPLLGLGFMSLASMCNGVCDVIGNVPFLRIVNTEERVQMTAIFSTWRDMAFVMTPGVASIALLFLDLAGLFVLIGVWLIIVSLLSRFLPSYVD